MRPRVGVCRPRIDKATVDLPRAGFADEAEAFAALQLEIDAVDRAQQPPAAAEQAAAQRKMDREILDAEDEIVVRPRSSGSCMVMAPHQAAGLEQRPSPARRSGKCRSPARSAD